MDWIMIVIAFILGAISMFCIRYAAKQEKPANRVHFYVVSDQVGTLWLCMGKPVRTSIGFVCCNGGQHIASAMKFSQYGLNVRDFDHLKTETIDVFVANLCGCIWSDYMFYENGKWRWNDFEPYYWMIPPKLPKE